MIQILKKPSDNYDIQSTVGTNFIPSASVGYYYSDDKQFNSFTGNVVINNNEGKLITHDSVNNFKSIQYNEIHDSTICFYNSNNIFEYKIQVTGLKEDQMIISNFKFIPLDSYFSLLWTVKADAIYKKIFKGPIRIIKISGNTLIFEADKNISNNLIDRMKSILTLEYNLEVGSFSKDIVLEGKINRYYNFGDKFIFYYNYLNINQLEKDQLVRVLFKKQIRDKQLININMI